MILAWCSIHLVIINFNAGEEVAEQSLRRAVTVAAVAGVPPCWQAFHWTSLMTAEVCVTKGGERAPNKQAGTGAGTGTAGNL